MKKTIVFALMAVALLLLPSQRICAQYFDHLALGVTVGFDGFGLELAAPLGNQFQVRAGYSMLPPMWKPHHEFTLEATEEREKTNVDLEAICKLGGANLMFDWHPAGGGFFLTAGMYAGSRKIFTVRNRKPFLDEEDWGSAGLVFGDIMVTTDDKGVAQVDLDVWPVRPYVGLGYGNAIKSYKRVGFNVELGACFTGGYKVMATGRNLETLEDGTIQVHSKDVVKDKEQYENDPEYRKDKNNYEDWLILDKMAKFPVLPILKFGLYIRLF